MQSDKQLDPSFVSTKSWDKAYTTDGKQQDVKRFKLPSLERGKISFSGKERNHLFQNVQGREFHDISGISGIDTPQDGRTFAVWDYDRDGWQDIALLNINTPVLSLYRNQQSSCGNSRNMIAVKLIGGNRKATPSKQFSSRDGFGARVSVNFSGRTLTRQHRCGEGLAAQNSRYLLFGIGDNDSVESIEVRWPSGNTQRVENVTAGQLATAFENAEESSDGSGFEVSRYLVDPQPVAKAAGEKSAKPSKAAGVPKSELTLFTSVATWCPNCRKQIPQLHLLRQEFTADQLGILGAAVDEGDSKEKLQQYILKNKPPYTLATPWNANARKNFNQLIKKELRSDVLPATVVFDRQGKMISVLPGVPTISDIKRMLVH